MDTAEAATKSVVEHKGSAGRCWGFSGLSAELSARCLYGTERRIVRQNAGYLKTLTRGFFPRLLPVPVAALDPVRRSKTDPEAKGATVALPYGSAAATCRCAATSPESPPSR